MIRIRFNGYHLSTFQAMERHPGLQGAEVASGGGGSKAGRPEKAGFKK